MKTHYDVLGVAKDCVMPEIKSAYRKLVKKFHPDVARGAGRGNSRIFEEITAAYSTLINPEKRKEYDNSLAGASSIAGAKKNGEPRKFRFREFKEWLFSIAAVRALFAGRKVSKPAPGIDQSILGISVDELIRNIIYSKNLHVQVNAVRAVIAKKRVYAVHDLLRLLYSNIADDVKIEIIRGLREAEDLQGSAGERVKKALREIYDIEKSMKVRQFIRKCVPA